MNPHKTPRLCALTIVCLALVLAVSACGQAPPTNTPEANTATPEMVETQVSAEQPTDTLEPTPDPTETPQPAALAESSASTTEMLMPQAEQLVVPVPPGNPPIIDDTLSAGEWDDAATELLSDGSELLLMHADCIKPTPGGMPPELHLWPVQWAEVDLSL